VVIERVLAAGESDSVRFVGVKVAGPERRLGSMQLSEGFPPDTSDFELGSLHDLPYTVAAGQSVELLLGYEMAAEGRWRRPQVVVQYRSNGSVLEQQFEAELIVCASARSVALNERA
jgi:hypothetical protein